MALEEIQKPNTVKILLDLINTKFVTLESRYETRHKSQLQELKVAASGEALVNQATELQKNFAEVENKLKALPDFVSNCELVKNIGSDRTNDMRELTALKADILELSTQIKTIKEMLSTGKGLQKNNNSLLVNPEDYKRLAPARINAASLSEIAEFVEGK